MTGSIAMRPSATGEQVRRDQAGQPGQPGELDPGRAAGGRTSRCSGPGPCRAHRPGLREVGALVVGATGKPVMFHATRPDTSGGQAAGQDTQVALRDALSVGDGCRQARQGGLDDDRRGGSRVRSGWSWPVTSTPGHCGAAVVRWAPMWAVSSQLRCRCTRATPRAAPPRAAPGRTGMRRGSAGRSGSHLIRRSYCRPKSRRPTVWKTRLAAIGIERHEREPARRPTGRSVPRSRWRYRSGSTSPENACRNGPVRV